MNSKLTNTGIKLTPFDLMGCFVSALGTNYIVILLCFRMDSKFCKTPNEADRKDRISEINTKTRMFSENASNASPYCPLINREITAVMQ